MESIKMLAIENIYPHPDNPRKDLGDLTELTESIRKNGVMQNLTVIPGHFDGKEWVDGGYTTLIGHRRAAAAKAAKVATVPCAVMHLLTKKEQVGIMLEENMQRADLTVMEQARGFQMMLDLGDTVDDVAKKTGFSKQTIKHRLEIAKLDPKAIPAAEEGGYYQISISDYMKLEKLPTIEDRNEVLRDARDGRQLDYKIRTKLQSIENQKKIKKITDKLEALGIKKAPDNARTWLKEWEYFRDVKLKDCDEEIKINIPKNPDNLFWQPAYECVNILRKTDDKKLEKKETDEDKEKRYNEKRRKAMRELQKQMEKKRENFIYRIAMRDVTPPPEDDVQELLEKLIGIAVDNGTYFEKMKVLECLMQKERFSASQEEFEKAEERYRAVSEIAKIIICVNRSFSVRTGTGAEELIDYTGKKRIERIVNLHMFYLLILEEGYGYCPSDLETAVMEGTHELFREWGQLTAKEKEKV